MTLLTIDALATHFGVGRKAIERSVKGFEPAGKRGTYNLYDLDQVSNEISRQAAIGHHPPEGCLSMTKLRAELHVGYRNMKSFRNDPTFPRPEGYYIDPKCFKSVPYYSIEKAKQWLDGEYEPAKRSPQVSELPEGKEWTVPRYSAKQTRECMRYRQSINDIFNRMAAWKRPNTTQ